MGGLFAGAKVNVPANEKEKETRADRDIFKRFEICGRVLGGGRQRRVSKTVSRLLELLILHCCEYDQGKLVVIE
jgi:hypothetical protein